MEITGSLAGGEIAVDVDNEDAVQAAKFATEAMSDQRFIYQLLRVINATSQVMAIYIVSDEECF